MIDHEKIEQAVRLLLEGIGEDIDREGSGRRPSGSPGCMRNCTAAWRKTPALI